MQAAGAAQEVEGGGGELAVVARPDEALLRHVVVEDPGARQVLLRLEGVEHEDPAVPGEPAVVEETEREFVLDLSGQSRELYAEAPRRPVFETEADAVCGIAAGADERLCGDAGELELPSGVVLLGGGGLEGRKRKKDSEGSDGQVDLAIHG